MSATSHPDDLFDEDPKFTAKVVEVVKNGEGWDTTRIGVFRDDVQIGQFDRNYPNHGDTAFAPFKRNGKWWALYSRHYTATRVMSLPDCLDRGGEEPNGAGFCPVYIAVPDVLLQDRPAPGDICPPYNHDSKVGTPEFASYQSASDAWYDRNPFRFRHLPVAFVAGCHWGDDSGGWKVQAFDLSRIEEGVLVRDERFGYLQLAQGVKLSDAYRITDYDCYHDEAVETCSVEFAVPASFSLKTGKCEWGHAYEPRPKQ